MTFSTAAHYAEKFSAWIAPHTVAAPTLAGSLRRLRPQIGDVDLVCIPQISETADLFGTITSRKNLLHEFLAAHVAASGARARFLSGGETPGKSVIIKFPKCQLDVWFATPETFATRLMCRTGSKEHNIWLAGRALRRGLKWNPYEGLLRGEALTRYGSEALIYEALGLPYIEPQHRELDWLVKNFGANQ